MRYSRVSALTALSAFLVATVLLACHETGDGTSPSTALVGTWGAVGGIAELTAEGGMFTFHCAHGEFDGPLRPEAAGEFVVSGWHWFARGAVPLDGYPREAALFQGVVRGDELDLRVTLVATGETVQALVLYHGVVGEADICR